MAFYYDHMKLNSIYSRTYGIGLIETAAHIHYDAEIAMVLEGGIDMTIKEESYHISEGGFCYINSSLVHTYKSQEPYSIVLFLGINRDFIKNLFPVEKNIHLVVEDYQDPSPIFNRIRTLLLASYSNFVSCDPFSSTSNHAIAACLVTLIYKHFALDDSPQSTYDIHDFKRNQQIENFVSENYAKDITLNMVAEQIHLSPYYTSHYFKKMFLTTFKHYLTSLRIMNAKQMLRNETIPITEIALSCGFGSSTTFSRVFKSEEGMTPTEYRNLYENSKPFFDENFLTGIYSTKTGLYISFSQEEHRQFLKKALSKFPIDPELFDFFTFR